jgi:hypothetical protein
MTSQVTLQIQMIELRQMLSNAGDDPILVPQLQERLADVENELKAVQHPDDNLFPIEVVDLPRTAIFLRGGGVNGETGIRPGLAGEALIQYERMFTAQAMFDERESARNAGKQRRPRGSAIPGLLFVGTPRGSFGFEFVPQATEDRNLLEIHARSLGAVADTLTTVAAGDFDLQRIPARSLQPLKLFFKTLSNYGAELRVAFGNRASRSLSVDDIKYASERLEREVTQDTVKIRGVVRGVTHESGYFDIKPDEGDVITGIVADTFSEEDMQRMDNLMDKPCVAELEKTTVNRIGGSAVTTYILLDIQ